MPRYEILDGQTVTNIIMADESFVISRYPGAWREVPEMTSVLAWDNAPAEYWYIEVGAFYDRFGPAKIPVLASSDATVQALVRDTQIRKYIDLKRPDVAQFVGYVATKVPEVTADIQAAVLEAPTTDEERYIKGLPQPNDPT